MVGKDVTETKVITSDVRVPPDSAFCAAASMRRAFSGSLRYTTI